MSTTFHWQNKYNFTKPGNISFIVWNDTVSISPTGIYNYVSKNRHFRTVIRQRKKIYIWFVCACLSEWNWFGCKKNGWNDCARESCLGLKVRNRIGLHNWKRRKSAPRRCSGRSRSGWFAYLPLNCGLGNNEMWVSRCVASLLINIQRPHECAAPLITTQVFPIRRL